MNCPAVYATLVLPNEPVDLPPLGVASFSITPRAITTEEISQAVVEMRRIAGDRPLGGRYGDNYADVINNSIYSVPPG